MTDARELCIETELSLDEATERVREQVEKSRPRVLIGRRSRLRVKLSGRTVRFHLHRGRLTFSEFVGTLSAGGRGALLAGRFESPQVERQVASAGLLSSGAILAGLALPLFSWQGPRTLLAPAAAVGFALVCAIYVRAIRRNVPIDIELLTREIERLFDASAEPQPTSKAWSTRNEPAQPSPLRPR